MIGETVLQVVRKAAGRWCIARGGGRPHRSHRKWCIEVVRRRWWGEIALQVVGRDRIVLYVVGGGEDRLAGSGRRYIAGEGGETISQVVGKTAL